MADEKDLEKTSENLENEVLEELNEEKEEVEAVEAEDAQTSDTVQEETVEEEYNGQAPLNVLKSNMEEKHGVSEDKVESLIRTLQQRGILYEPNSGYWKRV